MGSEMCIRDRVNRHQVVRFQEILARFPDTFACVSSVNETWGNFKHVA